MAGCILKIWAYKIFFKRIYQDLGLDSLKSKRWYKRLSCMFKIMNNEAPHYLLNLISKSQQTITTRNEHKNFLGRTYCFKNSFFPSTLKDWFNLNVSIRNSESLAIFKSILLSFIRPIQSKAYSIFDPIGLKLLTRLLLCCSHLNKHTFRIIFKTIWIPYVLVVWRLKIQYITSCTVIIFLIIFLFINLFINLVPIILSLFLIILK